MKPTDIFITAYLRPDFTKQTLNYLWARTKPNTYRVILIDNGGNAQFKDTVYKYIGLKQNLGIHAAWNMAMAFAESDYFITSDNDIYVPKVDPDWLKQLIKFMDDRPDYGAISLHPHVLIGAASFDPADPEDVKEVNMCGAVMRIMRRDAVLKAGGWMKTFDPKRNSEESTICSRLHTWGYQTGRTTRLRVYHPFGENWGYPEEFTPEMQGHRPELNDYVKQFDHQEAYDPETWLPK